MIEKLLVANRGEIARRVFATCRRMGIETVAVFSDADADLPFVGEADVAVRLAGNTPAETYLRAELIVAAAGRCGADAIHPGYGFLSENAGFARSVLEAGLTWIGPSPESIEAMGSKVAAKKLMADAGVPVFAELAPAAVTRADLPILVKASAGGGGRGMRVVRSLTELTDQIALASAEAESAFGDSTVFCEPYLEHGRHVEVQILGDAHGDVVVLGDRDCSIQRRHQKVIEEAPAPGLSKETRKTLHDGARLAAQAISYVGAGTVEFMILGEKVSFLEMNTRLQVEHPVTECVFGVDLVEAQIRVAEGSSAQTAVGATTSTLDPSGHAVEVRLYAEDPSANYQPQSGRLTSFEVPTDVEFDLLTHPGVRLDSGFVAGNEVGTFYDAMLAKVIAWGPDREAAIRRLVGALRQARLHGLRTNRDLLIETLTHPVFLAGEMSTDFLTDHDLAALQEARLPGTTTERALMFFAAAVATVQEEIARRRVQQGIPAGWRNVTSQPQVVVLDHDGTEVQVGWYGDRTGYHLAALHGDVEGARSRGSQPIPGGWRVVVEHDGVSRPIDVFQTGDRVDIEGPAGHLGVRLVPRFLDPADQVAAGSLLAPMPGTVIAVPVASGATVAVGETLLVLEAMKMQHSIKSPGSGLVAIEVVVGQQVSAGDVLAVVNEGENR